MTTVLTIPPTRAEDVERAKDFLFSVYGESRWTEEKYLELSERTNRLIELSEGRLTVLAMPTPEHQDIVGNLYVFIRIWARKYKGRAFMSPMPVRLWAGKFREPDVVLYSAEHQDRVAKQYGGIPDWTVEVLSPGTEKTDTDEKMGEYAQAGIPEYWVVAAERPQVEQYVLDGGLYRLHAQLGVGEIVRAVTLPDLEIKVDEFYAA